MSDAVKRRAHATAHLRAYAEAGGWTVEIQDDHRRLAFERLLRPVDAGVRNRIVMGLDDQGGITVAELLRIVAVGDRSIATLLVMLGAGHPDKRAHVLAWLH